MPCADLSRPGAMQARMQLIQEMNTLISNLMRAYHDMQMEVIRNVRA